MAAEHRLRPLDGVRALAVLAVLAAHAGLPFLPGGSDGVHLTPDGVRWLTPWLVRALSRAAR